MATSFQKKPRMKGILQIPGTRPSLFNNQLLVSTGVPSLDNVVGGGMAVGSVLLVEEDTFGSYAKLLLKYFCAEAVMTSQSLFLAGADVNPEQIISEMPAPVVDDPGNNKDTEVTEVTEESDKMKIAWRYQNQPKYQSNPTVNTKFGHYYDLTKQMDESLIKRSSTTLLDMSGPLHCENSSKMNIKYQRLLQRIKSQIDDGMFGTSSKKEKRNVLRIAVHSLGSPFWGENGGISDTGQKYDPSLAMFLLSLRSLLRSAFAVCLITMPTHLFAEPLIIDRIEKLCDTVIELESFAGSEKEKNPAFQEYHGLLNIKHLPRLNSLVSHMPETFDLAFKLRRKKFTIEQLHLPPELSETVSRAQEDPIPQITQSGLCSSSLNKNKLDF